MMDLEEYSFKLHSTIFHQKEKQQKN